MLGDAVMQTTDDFAHTLPARRADAVTAAGALHRSLTLALASEQPAVGRLRYARTSVRFVVGGEGVTLLLDRSPPAVGDADEPAEIEIDLSPEQAMAFARGGISLVEALIRDDVVARGPVRRYMEVDPILRRLLGLVDDGAAAPSPTRTGARQATAAPAIPADRLAIQTCGLHKSFGPSHILRGCDLKIPEGVISVILGPSGTGKSVMLQHIIGLMAPDAGEVLIRGNRLSDMSRSEVLGLRREIGVMFQDGALFSTMNIYDNVAFPLRQHTNLADDQVREVVEARLADVGLLHSGDRMPGQLSGGMKKRAGLARSLVLDPGIILCDEPDSGLDPVRTSLLGDLLVDQHAEHGGTMIVVTHNVPLARQISDHISVLWQGQVLLDGLADEIFESDDPFVRQFLASETIGPLTMDA
jgi:ABC-type transporter Mla maintaining outer membrane lipid asymmetry ATPase subunit MlaF